MAGDEVVAGGQVGSRDDRVDLLQGHVERPEPADDLSGRDLIGGVAAMPCARVDVGGLEQADAVVMAQRLDTQVRGPGEVTDGQRAVHVASMRSPPMGDTSAQMILLL